MSVKLKWRLFKKKHFLTASVCLGLMAVPNHSNAEGRFLGMRFGEPSKEPQKVWDVKLGVGYATDYKYEGSDEKESKTLPMIDITWNDTIFLSPMEGLGIHVLKTEFLSLSGSLGWDEGRRESASDDLDGLGNIDAGLTTSYKISLDLGPLSIFTDNTDYHADGVGSTKKYGAELMIPMALFSGKSIDEIMRENKSGPKGLAFRLEYAVEWADDDYMQSYFSVDEKQSRNSGLEVTEVEAGVVSTSFGVGMMIPFGDNLMMRLGTEYKTLKGDAADSPIVKKKNTQSTMMGIMYRF